MVTSLPISEGRIAESCMPPEYRDAALLWDMLRHAREGVGFVEGRTWDEHQPDPLLRRADERSVGIVDACADGRGHEVEFFTLTGQTIAVATVTADQVRPIADSDAAHARRIAGQGPMTIHDLRRAIQTHPFTINMSDGRTFEVATPR
jgi:hypothetical protein